jgi:thiosulfate dehydrogenase [quinone] large subunit
MNYSKSQQFVLVLLRVLIGWHFLYEGLLKLLSPSWSAKRYLMSSESFLDNFFAWLSSDAMIGIIDFMTIALLLIVGLTLILGIFEKIGILAGVALLVLFYLAHPSFPGIESAAPSEGNYFIVNKNLIELAALLVLWFFPTSKYFGLSQLFSTSKPAKLATK